MTDEDWTRVCGYIQSALDLVNTHTLDDVFAGIKAGRYQVWAGKNCAIVTEILSYPLCRDLNYWLAGGDIEEMKTLEPGIEAWARGANCRRTVTLGTRTAGRKILQARGYFHQAEVMARDL